MTTIEDRLEAARRVTRAMTSPYYRRLAAHRNVIPVSMDDPMSYVFEQVEAYRSALVVVIDEVDRDVWMDFYWDQDSSPVGAQKVAPQASYGMLLDVIRETGASRFEMCEPEIAFSLQPAEKTEAGV